MRLEFDFEFLKLEVLDPLKLFGQEFNLEPLFFRAGPAYQNMKHERAGFGGPLREGRTESYGVEFGIGGRVYEGNWAFEVLPLTLFWPMRQNLLSGNENEPKADYFRFLTARVGYVF